MKMTKDLTEGNLYKNFLIYVIPLILSSLLSSLYSTIDAMIAGRFISEHALGAISSTSSYDVLFRSLFQGFGGGFSVYVAHLFGRKDFVTLKRDVLQVISLIAGVILFVSVGTILFRNPIMDYLKVDPLLRADAETYFVIYSSAYVLLYLNQILVQILHALGVTSFSLYISLGSAVLNIGGNLLTVLVFRMGVAGLACSTVFSTAAATAFYAVMLCRAFRELPTERIGFRFGFAGIRHSLRYTVPAAVQQVAFHGVGIVLAPTINGLGAAATTGETVKNQMYNMCAQSFWNTSAAVGVYTGQCVGAGKPEKIRRGLWVGLQLNALILLPFVLVFTVLAEPIASLFFPSDFAGEALDYAVRFARGYMFFLYINMIGHLLHTYLRGLGAVNVVFRITIIGSAVRIAVTLLLVPVIGMEGAYIGLVLGWTADAIASCVIYAMRYRTEAHLTRVVERERARKTAISD